MDFFSIEIFHGCSAICWGKIDIHRPQCNYSVFSYLNKAIEKMNLRATFFYSCIVQGSAKWKVVRWWGFARFIHMLYGVVFTPWPPASLIPKTVGVLEYWSIPFHKFEWDITVRDLLTRWRENRLSRDARGLLKISAHIGFFLISTFHTKKTWITCNICYES